MIVFVSFSESVIVTLAWPEDGFVVEVYVARLSSCVYRKYEVREAAVGIIPRSSTEHEERCVTKHRPSRRYGIISSMTLLLCRPQILDPDIIG